jgi:hypothetical protein
MTEFGVSDLIQRDIQTRLDQVLRSSNLHEPLGQLRRDCGRPILGLYPLQPFNSHSVTCGQ